MKKRESGQVVVEASIVVTLVFMVISTMLYIGMAMYQQTAISVIANRTATNIAQVYSNNLKDPFTGYYDPESAYQSVTYGNMKTDAYIDSLEQKGIAFAEYRLKKAQIISAIDRDVEVNVVQKPGEVLKAQIVVTIEDSYNVPLMRLFGVNGDISFSGTGRADCVDLLEYFNGIEAVADPENSPIPSLPDSDTCVITFVRDRKSSEFHEAVPVLRGKSIITSNRYSHSVMPKDPTLGDLRFLGWYTEEGRRFGATHTVERNMTVYGRWECRIDLDACGGTVEPSFVAAEYGQPTILPTPVRYSFAFEGWYTERDGAGERFVSGVAEITSDITLYAKW